MKGCSFNYDREGEATIVEGVEPVPDDTEKETVKLDRALSELIAIGMALSAEHDLPRVLDKIIDSARFLTNADGGTLYLAEGDPPTSLRYSIIQNLTLRTWLGGMSGNPVPYPNIPLIVDGEPNYKNICAYAATTGTTINIPDCYHHQGFDFTGPKLWDMTNNYRSKSFLVVPMRDHEDQLIGVLQLINAADPLSGEIVAFSERDVRVIEALASQAAIAITNMKLIRDTENLFEAFSEVLAAAIDERSPATSGHIKRVTQLTVALARAVNEQSTGRFAQTTFSTDELRELRLAALLHDLGKVATPIHIVEKHGKLETIYDRIKEVITRFELIKRTIECDYLQRKIELVHNGASPQALEALEHEMAAKMAEVTEEQAFIAEVNRPVEYMETEKVERVKAIGAKTFRLNGVEQPYLEPNEIKNLTIQKGNITGEELQIMRDHAAISIRLLSQIPFTRKLRNIPRYAGAHHELLNGRGYPLRLSGDEIALQTRIMTIADIYDALTAADRSYKKGRSQEEALRILELMSKDGELDRDLLDLFISSGIYKMIGQSEADMKRIAAAVEVAASRQPQ